MRIYYCGESYDVDGMKFVDGSRTRSIIVCKEFVLYSTAMGAPIRKDEVIEGLITTIWFAAPATAPFKLFLFIYVHPYNEFTRQMLLVKHLLNLDVGECLRYWWELHGDTGMVKSHLEE